MGQQILQDQRHRKAYIASSDGQINVINIQSGVCLKQCFEHEDTQTALEEDYKKLQKKMAAKLNNARAAQNQVKQVKARPPSAESADSPRMGKSAAFMTEAPVG